MCSSKTLHVTKLDVIIIFNMQNLMQFEKGYNVQIETFSSYDSCKNSIHYIPWIHIYLELIMCFNLSTGCVLYDWYTLKVLYLLFNILLDIMFIWHSWVLIIMIHMMQCYFAHESYEKLNMTFANVFVGLRRKYGDCWHATSRHSGSAVYCSPRSPPHQGEHKTPQWPIIFSK